jgi:hypothetical protein
MNMKKLVVATLFAFAISSAFAQVQFALGLKAGPNFSSINTKESASVNYKSRTGFHGGAFFLFKFTKIGIQPELLFSQQGGTVKINSKDYETNFNYINIPVVLKLYLAAGLNLQLGPQIGFVSLAEGPTYNGASGNYSVEDIKDQVKKYDLSAAMGAGWDLPFGLTIDARYNLGLSKINNNKADPAAKNQVFQFSLGYKIFKFGK